MASRPPSAARTQNVSAVIAAMDPEHRAYAEWLATPKRFREEGLVLKKEYAERVGVTTHTLRQWEQKPGFQALVEKESVAWLKRVRPRVREALVQTAEIVGKEGTADRKLFFTLTKDLVTQKEVNVNQTIRFDDMSEREVIDDLDAALDDDLLGDLLAEAEDELNKLTAASGVDRA